MPNPYFKQITLSLAASGDTGWFDLVGMHHAIEIHNPGTGAPEGTFCVDTSNDPAAVKTMYATLDPTTFVPTWDNPGGTTSVVTTSIEFDSAKAYGRIRYVRTGGGTACTATINYTAKE
jgi:hypothetical protein